MKYSQPQQMYLNQSPFFIHFCKTDQFHDHLALSAFFYSFSFSCLPKTIKFPCERRWSQKNKSKHSDHLDWQSIKNGRVQICHNSKPKFRQTSERETTERWLPMKKLSKQSVKQMGQWIIWKTENAKQAKRTSTRLSNLQRLEILMTHGKQIDNLVAIERRSSLCNSTSF